MAGVSAHKRREKAKKIPPAQDWGVDKKTTPASAGEITKEETPCNARG